MERNKNRSDNDIDNRLLKEQKKEPFDPIKGLLEAQLALEQEEDRKYGIVYEDE